MGISSISSRDVYANNPNYLLLDERLVADLNSIKRTYRDVSSLFVKVLRVALAVLLTLATLGFALCFLKGRLIWMNALDPFKNRIFFESILQRKKDEILNDNPDWVTTVSGWKDISLTDQIWVLQLCELRKLKVKLSSLDSILDSTITIVDHTKIHQVLDLKKDIEIDLASVKELSFFNMGLEKCPDVLCLFPNLQALDLSCNNLKMPPNLSGNQFLENLNLSENKLICAPDIRNNPLLEVLELIDNQLTIPPDVKSNPNLRFLILNENLLTLPPDVSRNPRLQSLDIECNKLTMAPDVSNNPELTELCLSRTSLTKAPNVSQNPALETLYIRHNPITSPPDVSHNPVLKELNLLENQLQVAPDVSRNPQLEVLILSKNKLTILPDISNNPKLKNLHLSGNAFDQQGLVNFKKSCNPKTYILI